MGLEKWKVSANHFRTHYLTSYFHVKWCVESKELTGNSDLEPKTFSVIQRPAKMPGDDN